jgi:fructose-bisphosphate aldolase class 1
MAYSILSIYPEKDIYMVYCSIKSSVILTGQFKECETFKHIEENAEQQTAVHTHLEGLRRRYVVMLMQGGHTEEEANIFLKKRMPKLYEL